MQKKTRKPKSIQKKSQASLAGIVVGETSICSVGKEGIGLTYRGYNIKDLAKGATFEEVGYLLLYGKLPSVKEYTNFKKLLLSSGPLPSSFCKMLQLLPASANAMDVVRTIISFAGAIFGDETENVAQIASRLLVLLLLGLLYWYNLTHDMTTKMNIISDNLAYNFLYILHQTNPDEQMVKALDVSLILYAEHEFNASTFATRVTCATQSDIYSCLTTGIGTLKGPLHGGANEAALDLIMAFDTPERAIEGVSFMLDNKQKIMGFGHRVYKDCDPRSNIIKGYVKDLAVTPAYKDLFAIAEAIEHLMKKKKNLFPNLDFYSALVYHFCGIPKELFTPIFVLSRMTGWCAHVLEQRQHQALIRPSALYVGPKDEKFIPLDKR